MLDIMEGFVQEKRYSYVRMDGGTPISARQPLVQRYNNVSIFIGLVKNNFEHQIVQLTLVNSTMHNSILSLIST